MSKHKYAPRNPILYWWNELLFARYFEYETSLSPDDLADNFHRLQHPRIGWMWGLEKTSKIDMHPNGKGLDFDIQSRRKRLLDPIGITTARAQGSAVVDSGTGQTIVQGTVKLGRLFHIFLLIYVTIIAIALFPLFIRTVSLTGTPADLLAMSIPLLMFGAMLGFYWWRIYRDRNDLTATIETAVHEEKAKRSAERFIQGQIADEGVHAWDEGKSSKQNIKRHL